MDLTKLNSDESSQTLFGLITKTLYDGWKFSFDEDKKECYNTETDTIEPAEEKRVGGEHRLLYTANIHNVNRNNSKVVLNKNKRTVEIKSYIREDKKEYESVVSRYESIISIPSDINIDTVIAIYGDNVIYIYGKCFSNPIIEL